MTNLSFIKDFLQHKLSIIYLQEDLSDPSLVKKNKKNVWQTWDAEIGTSAFDRRWCLPIWSHAVLLFIKFLLTFCLSLYYHFSYYIFLNIIFFSFSFFLNYSSTWSLNTSYYIFFCLLFLIFSVHFILISFYATRAMLSSHRYCTRTKALYYYHYEN